MTPYKLQLGQHLKDTDKPLHRDFCIVMQQKMENDGFDDRLVFSDEAIFHVNGKVTSITLAYGILRTHMNVLSISEIPQR